MNDLKFRLHRMLKNPSFTAVVVLTLALGNGPNTVVFSVARTVLIRPHGFDGEDRLTWIRLANAQTGGHEVHLSWQDQEDIRVAQSFESVATFGLPGVTWEDGDQSEEVAALRVTPNLADVLGSRPAVERMPLPSTFSRAAFLLAAIGTDGSVRFSVQQRMREIGLRMVVGAQNLGFLSLVMGRGLKLALIGVALGITLVPGIGAITKGGARSQQLFEFVDGHAGITSGYFPKPPAWWFPGYSNRTDRRTTRQTPLRIPPT